MKKLVFIIMCLIMSLSVVACSSGGDKDGAKETKKEKAKSYSGEDPSVNNPDRLKDYDIKDIDTSKCSEAGKGDLYLTQRGEYDLKKGTVPVVYAGKDDPYTDVSVSTRGFDSSKLSFIYVDQILYDKQQLGDDDFSVSIQMDQMKPGKHKIEILQYEGDKPKGKAVTYKSGEYEVKEK